MSPELILGIGRDALWVAMLVAGPMLLAALVVGLLVGFFQAATQINEMTLTFVPKLLTLAAVMAVGGPWMLRQLTDYTTALIQQIPMWIG
ncbi:MAG TPA: flagellar biosynthesis protein FliQ [Burkholderiaceae bacterium]